MALQAYVVVFSSSDTSEADKVLPEQEEVLEAFKDYLDIPDDNVLVNMWPVNINSVGYDPEACRRCQQPVEEGRLFCDDCSKEIAEGECEEEAEAS